MTLTCFKDLCRRGMVSLEMIEYYGKTDIPEKLRGVRKVTGANTVAVMLRCSDGEESELRLNRASLVTINNILTVYEAGTRKPDVYEQKLLDEWKGVQERYKKQNPDSDTYWQKNAFFDRAGKAYLAGFETQRGMRYSLSTGKIIDESIKGRPILKYKIMIEIE